MRHPKRRIVAPVLVAGIALLLAACGNSNGQNSLKPNGSSATKIDDLFIPILTVAIVIGILVLGATVFAAVKFRHREGKPDNPKQIHGNTPLEIGWTIVPALILAVVAVPTVATIWDLAEQPEGPRRPEGRGHRQAVVVAVPAPEAGDGPAVEDAALSRRRGPRPVPVDGAIGHGHHVDRAAHPGRDEGRPARCTRAT